MKKVTNGRQYLLTPLIVRFENEFFVTQRICKVGSASSHQMLKRIRSLFAQKSKSLELETKEGYFEKDEHQKVKTKKDLILDKLLKSNSAYDQAMPLSV